MSQGHHLICSWTYPSVKSLIQTLVISRLDYSNLRVSDLLLSHLGPLTSLQYSAFKILSLACHSDIWHFSLLSLYWFLVHFHIQHELYVLIFKALHCLAHGHWSSSSTTIFYCPKVSYSFQRLPPAVPGTSSPNMYATPPVSPLSKSHLKINSFRDTFDALNWPNQDFELVWWQILLTLLPSLSLCQILTCNSLE